MNRKKTKNYPAVIELEFSYGCGKKKFLYSSRKKKVGFNGSTGKGIIFSAFILLYPRVCVTNTFVTVSLRKNKLSIFPEKL